MISLCGAAALLLLVAAATTVAAPVVLSVDGTATSGQNLVISGNDFGTKVPAAPLKYDDFQSGSPGEPLSPGSEPGWNLWYNGETPPSYTDANPRLPGDISSLQVFGNGQTNCTIGLQNLTLGQIYVSGWALSTTAGDQADNFKVIGEWVGAWGEPSSRWDMHPTEGNGHVYVRDCSGNLLSPNTWNATADKVGLGQQQWHRIESFYQRGVPSSNQWAWRIWIDAVGIVDIAGESSNLGCNQDRIYLTSYYRRQGGNAIMNWQWSELYVDTTPARVEIGDAATWDDCHHREIQLPTAWSNNEITITFKSGTFAPGSQVYLFVVDPQGEPAAEGLPLTIGATYQGGGQEDPGPPGTPGQPQRKQ